MLVSSCVLLPAVHMLPGDNCGSVESVVDTWYMLSHSWVIAGLVASYTLALSLMNVFSVQLGKAVSAVYRQLVNALRVVSIWIISILMFYWWTRGRFGESWDQYSYMQLGGFVLLLAGTWAYGTDDGEAMNDESKLAPDAPFHGASLLDDFDESPPPLPADEGEEALEGDGESDADAAASTTAATAGTIAATAPSTTSKRNGGIARSINDRQAMIEAEMLRSGTVVDRSA
jgi:hypothetical protein